MLNQALAPERLVVMGLRGWLAGYETGDIACWEAVWNDYARELGPDRAKPVVADEAAFFAAVRENLAFDQEIIDLMNQ